jgi:NADH-quinone oxidoreductase E subunit
VTPIKTAMHAYDTKTFVFSRDNFRKAEAIIGKYPKGRQQSAVLPLLDLAQRQSGGWLPRPAMDYIASILGMAPVRVYEVASFYTMFNLKPVGKYLVQVCGTTPCWLCGSDDVMKACRDNLGIEVGGTTDDGLFTLKEVECLGACANAPMVQINDDYFEDLNADSTHQLLNDLREGRKVATGSQTERQCSAPTGS